MTLHGSHSVATQRNRYMAHSMWDRGVPKAVIAAHLGVEVRSVLRYLAADCPPLPAEPEAGILRFLKQHGVCGGRPDIDWFSDNPGEISQAKEVCRTCPVREKCLNYAVAVGEPIGVWGGLTERERRNLGHSHEGVA